MRISTLTALVLVILFVSNVFAGGFIGSPTADLADRQFGVGVELSHSSIDFDSATMQRRFDALWDGDLLDFTTTDTVRAKHRNFDSNRYYGVFSYAIKSFEFNVKLGLSDLKGESSFDGEMQGHNFDSDFAWGVGAKYTFLEYEKMDWGVSVQMNWVDTDWDSSSSPTEGELLNNKVDVDYYDIIVALGPNVKIGDWNLYGGPFYHYISGTYKENRSESSTVGDHTFAAKRYFKSDLEADGLGGFIGAKYNLSENCTIGTEFSAADHGWAIGGNLTFKF
jgi:hypothetical protein